MNIYEKQSNLISTLDCILQSPHPNCKKVSVQTAILRHFFAVCLCYAPVAGILVVETTLDFIDSYEFHG